MMKQGDVQQVAAWLTDSQKTVVFSGAGMSTESGIPDFRSPNGLWTKTDPMEVASVEAMHHQYDLFHEFYCLRFETKQRCQPHQGHYLLSKWEEGGLVHAIATQNVDGFHKQAGSKKVFELHGAMDRVRCITNGHPGTPEEFIQQKPCRECGDRLRPGVVLFGESLPMDAWNQAFQEIQAAEVLMVIGTSLQVSPVNQLPSMAKGKTVLINREPVTGSVRFDQVILGSAGDVLSQLNDLIQEVRQ